MTARVVGGKLVTADFLAVSRHLATTLLIHLLAHNHNPP